MRRHARWRAVPDRNIRTLRIRLRRGFYRNVLPCVVSLGHRAGRVVALHDAIAATSTTKGTRQFIEASARHSTRVSGYRTSGALSCLPGPQWFALTRVPPPGCHLESSPFQSP
jgi:hypothetical protein